MSISRQNMASRWSVDRSSGGCISSVSWHRGRRTLTPASYCRQPFVLQQKRRMHTATGPRPQGTSMWCSVALAPRIHTSRWETCRITFGVSIFMTGHGIITGMAGTIGKLFTCWGVCLRGRAEPEDLQQGSPPFNPAGFLTSVLDGENGTTRRTPNRAATLEGGLYPPGLHWLWRSS
jgi:hypothetical protein